MKPNRELKNFKKFGAPLSAKPVTAPAVPAKPAPPPAALAPAASPTKTVTIEAKIDVGFGNKLFLRGEGKGLSWSHGVPLTCVDASTWKWSGEAGDPLRFKVLLNDAVWCKGEDLVARPGQQVQLSPAF
ncbi:MAG: hypothetical protein U1F98_14420 [Verrucomicrobiota bacterium]